MHTESQPQTSTCANIPRMNILMWKVLDMLFKFCSTSPKCIKRHCLYTWHVGTSPHCKTYRLKDFKSNGVYNSQIKFLK